MAEVTVVIPNYNGMKYIEGCLDSLYRLKEQELFRVLVVDNGSVDGSARVIREKYPQVQLVCLAENTGFCHAVNVGVRKARTPFVLLLNNDTVVLEGFVEALYQAIVRDEKIFAVSGKMLAWDCKDRIDDAGDRYCVLGWAFSRGKGKKASDFDKPSEVFAACGGASIYRKAIMEKIGYFDEAHFAYLEDIDICYRARIYGYRSRYEPSAQVLHAGSASSGSRYNEWKTRLASANSVAVIGKNMPLLQWIFNFPFLLAGFSIKTLFFVSKKMGILYLKGLYQGLRRMFSPQGKASRVPFQWKHLRNYLAIQIQLYLNFFRFPFKL